MPSLPDPIEITGAQREGSLVLRCRRVEGLPLPSVTFSVSMTKRGFAGSNPHVGLFDDVLRTFVEELTELDRTPAGRSCARLHEPR